MQHKGKTQGSFSSSASQQRAHSFYFISNKSTERSERHCIMPDCWLHSRSVGFLPKVTLYGWSHVCRQFGCPGRDCCWWRLLAPMTVLHFIQSWYKHLPLNWIRQDFTCYLHVLFLQTNRSCPSKDGDFEGHLVSQWCAALGTKSTACALLAVAGVCGSHPALGRLAMCPVLL